MKILKIVIAILIGSIALIVISDDEKPQELANLECYAVWSVSNLGTKISSNDQTFDQQCSGVATQIKNHYETELGIDFGHPKLIAEGDNWQRRKSSSGTGLVISITTYEEMKET